MNRRTGSRHELRVEGLEERCALSATPWTDAPLAAAAAQVASDQPGNGHLFCVGRNDADLLTVPFRITGGGPAPGGIPLVPGESALHQIVGTASMLGKHTGVGSFTTGSLSISETGQVTATFQGTAELKAANGDILTFNYGSGFTGVFTGQLSADGTTVLNGTFDAIFTPDASKSTGRFADVAGGSFRMIAKAPSVSLLSTTPGFTAPFDYTWSGEGSLTFNKAKK